MNRRVGMKMNRRTLAKGSALSAFGLAASSRFAVPTILGQEKAKVLFWTTYSGDTYDRLSQITDAYNAQSDKYSVEIVQRPSEGGDDASLFTAVRSGEGPDAYTLDRFAVAERAGQGLLEDLTPLMEAAGDPTDLSETYIAFAANEATYNGAAYALPFDTDVRILWYRANQLQDLGVDLDALDPTTGKTTTWDQFAEWAHEYDTKDGDDWSTLGFVPDEGQGNIYTWGFAFGAEYFDWDKCEVTPDHPQMIKAAQWVQDYDKALDPARIDAFLAPEYADGATAMDDPWIQTVDNGYGRLMSVIGGSWNVSYLQENIPDVDMRFMLLPTDKEGDESHTWAGGWSAIVPTGSKNAEGGYDFIRYLCGVPGQRKWYELNTGLPTISSLLQDETLYGDNEVMKLFGTVVLPTAKNRPALPVGGKYLDELYTAWDEIKRGLNSPEEALQVVKENTQTELDAMGACPLAKPVE